MEKIKDDSEDDEEITITEEISRILFDKDNPEMITNISHSELDRINILATLSEDENELRDELAIPTSNIMAKLVKNNLIYRTSINGWRAKQGENIIGGGVMQMNEENKSFDSKIGNILGKGSMPKG